MWRRRQELERERTGFGRKRHEFGGEESGGEKTIRIWGVRDAILGRKPGIWDPSDPSPSTAENRPLPPELRHDALALQTALEFDGPDGDGE
uniref:Uncharacterized protein n=1 Tax=Apteryx owenii TaxID=8824 RepID=A0A8B9PBG1_APTOW